MILHNNVALISEGAEYVESESPKKTRFRLSHCGMTPPSQGTPVNIHKPYIVRISESRVTGLHRRR